MWSLQEFFLNIYCIQNPNFFKKEASTNKLTSEFNKFKDFGIDLNDAHKTSTKTKKSEKIVKKVNKMGRRPLSS